MAHRGVAQEKALRLMLRPAADHRVHQDYISDHLELTGERKEEEEEADEEVKNPNKQTNKAIWRTAYIDIIISSLRRFTEQGE